MSKIRNILRCALAVGLLICISPTVRANEYTDANRAAQSLIWEQLPYQWNEGAFLGNGIVGMVVYVDSVDNSLTLHLCRPDVTDHRKGPGMKSSLGEKGADVMFDFCRLDVGKFKLYPESKITGGNMVLDIYSGMLKGTIHTNGGDVAFTIFTPCSDEVNVVEYKSFHSLICRFIPGSPQSPRTIVFPWTKKQTKYQDNPAPVLNQNADEGTCVQSLLAGGDYATYWKRQSVGDVQTVYISTANEVPAANLSLKKAQAHVNTASAKGVQALEGETSEWWNQYLSESFISIPDKKLENFYSIQMYKLATCSNPKGPAMDNFGTFFKTSQWPGMWWNLNVQLTYQSVYPNNRMAQGINFQTLMDTCFIRVINHILPQKAGDYGWALHNYYLYLRYTGADNRTYRLSLCPKIKALLKIYGTQLKYKDGQLMLIGMESPEYEGFKTYENSNYNLAVLRWLIQTLVKYESAKDTDAIYWKKIYRELPDYPKNENGMMIANAQPLAKSHRHYSHLLAFYPLHLMDVDNPSVKSLLEKSISHWLNIGGGKELAGYSYTGSASLYALMGNGESAYRQLSHFINEPIGISLLLPNTLYVESGGRNPVIETPLSASTALAEMMIQSWGDVIRVFPAIPQSWGTCCFNNLRAEGGFDVSAQKERGKVRWIKIKSEFGKSCKMKLPSWNTCYVLKNGKTHLADNVGKGVFSIKIKKGETVILVEDKNEDDHHFTFAPPMNMDSNFYGVKKGHGLKCKMDW
jgi:alpha-L-fucosidase 2